MDNENKKDSIRSPYSKEFFAKLISKEQLEQVRKILGFKQIFIIASNNSSSKSGPKDVVCTGLGFPPTILKEILEAVAVDVLDRIGDEFEDDESTKV